MSSDITYLINVYTSQSPHRMNSIFLLSRSFERGPAALGVEIRSTKVRKAGKCMVHLPVLPLSLHHRLHEMVPKTVPGLPKTR